MDITYDNVKPLVSAAQDEAGYVLVTFTCPATGLEVRAEGPWPEDGLVERTAKRSKRSLFASIRNSVSSSVRRAAGTGLAGSLGGEAAAAIVQNAGQDIEQGKAHGDKDRERAIVAAFASVQPQFRWDDAGSRWVAASAAQVETSPFTEHLAAHRLVEDYDREVLARMLAALIATDGAIGDDEREAFAQLVPGADLDLLVDKRAPGAVDFEETSMGSSRETLLLLGWAVALSDETLGDLEIALLATAAKGLGVGEERAAELKQTAQRHIIEEAIVVLAAQGKDADAIRAEVEPVGEAIGIGADEAARAVIRWDKRQR